MINESICRECWSECVNCSCRENKLTDELDRHKKTLKSIAEALKDLDSILSKRCITNGETEGCVRVVKAALWEIKETLKPEPSARSK